jgi:hypothetical protein
VKSPPYSYFACARCSYSRMRSCAIRSPSIAKPVIECRKVGPPRKVLVSVTFPRAAATTTVNGAVPDLGLKPLSLTPPPVSLLVSATSQRDGELRAAVPMREQTAGYGGGHLRAAQRSQGWQRDPAGTIRGRLLLKGLQRHGARGAGRKKGGRVLVTG